MTVGKPVPLFVPPDLAKPVVPPLAMPPLPSHPTPSGTRLLIGVVKIDRSGRVRDRELISALGWGAGDRLGCRVYDIGVVLERVDDGPFVIDPRDQVFIPAGTRSLLRIGSGDRVVLVAAPDKGLLIVHPTPVVTSVLASHYASVPGGLGVC